MDGSFNLILVWVSILDGGAFPVVARDCVNVTVRVPGMEFVGDAVASGGTGDVVFLPIYLFDAALEASGVDVCKRTERVVCLFAEYAEKGRGDGWTWGYDEWFFRVRSSLFVGICVVLFRVLPFLGVGVVG